MDALDYLSEGARMRAKLDEHRKLDRNIREARIEMLRRRAISPETPEDVAMRDRLLAGASNLDAEVDLRWPRRR